MANVSIIPATKRSVQNGGQLKMTTSVWLPTAVFPREMKVSRLPIRPRKLFIRVSSPANRAGVSLASMRTKHCPARAVRTAWSSTA